MNMPIKLILILLILPLIAAGCGCGGDTSADLTSLLTLEITPVNPSIALGTDQQFMATGIYSDGARQDMTNSVIWTSSDTGVATISNEIGSQGLAPSQAVGSTTITATSGSISGSTTLTVTAAALVSIMVLPSNPSVGLGTQQQFTAIGTFSDDSTQDITTSVTWSSSSPSIAEISDLAGSKGLATASGIGSTTVTASSGDISGSTLLTVTEASLVSIEVTPVSQSVQIKSTLQYTATGTFSDNTTQDVTKLAVWTSSNNSIAGISNIVGSQGLATALAAGSTTITATVKNISGSASLTVQDAFLVSIAVTPKNAYAHFNEYVQFTATGTYSDGTTKDITNVVIWSSSVPSVATISNDPGSKGLALTDGVVGSTTILANLGNIYGWATLTDP